MPTVKTTDDGSYVKEPLENEALPIGATLVRTIYLADDGAFQAGTGTKDVDLNGTVMDEDEIVGQKNGVDQFSISAVDGRASAGRGVVTLDENGIDVVVSQQSSGQEYPNRPYERIHFKNTGTIISEVSPYLTDASNVLKYQVSALTNKHSYAYIIANTGSGKNAEAYLQASSIYGTAKVYAHADDSSAKVIVDPDLEVENDHTVNGDIEVLGSTYLRGSVFFGNYPTPPYVLYSKSAGYIDFTPSDSSYISFNGKIILSSNMRVALGGIQYPLSSFMFNTYKNDANSFQQPIVLQDTIGDTWDGTINKAPGTYVFNMSGGVNLRSVQVKGVKIYVSAYWDTASDSNYLAIREHTKTTNFGAVKSAVNGMRDQDVIDIPTTHYGSGYYVDGNYFDIYINGATAKGVLVRAIGTYV